MEQNSETKSLVKFQLGPVQDFIAQARSTRDLWSGSYLLSWLVAAGIKALPATADLIFPCRDEQPLLQEPLDSSDAGLLTPNLPNLFIAEVPSSEARKITMDVEKAIQDAWQNISRAVWAKLTDLGLADSLEARFFAQVDRHLSLSCVITPLGGSYSDTYKRNSRNLDAVRQTRDFNSWSTESGPPQKDSLSGKEEALLGGADDREQRQRLPEPYRSLFAKHADYLGAVSIIKRCWHLAYLKEKAHLPADSESYKIRSIPAIAARSTKLDDNEEAQEKVSGENYIAALAFDGDSIGKWVNGDFLASETDLRTHHTDFSQALSTFALRRVREIVEEKVSGLDEKRNPTEVPLGQLIYAGGDDVVALVPADMALEVAEKLRKAFLDATTSIQGTDGSTPIQPDASVGIAIAHIRSPLQDLIREAQKAEKKAKKDGPKPAFSVTLLKRSGEISHWTARWESGATELYEAIFTAMAKSAANDKRLSTKFPHRLCELLEPHRCQKSALSSLTDAADFDVRAIIEREFRFAAERQGNKAIAEGLFPILKKYLDQLPNEPQAQLDAIFGLATTLAFAFRNLPKTQPPAERQSDTP